MQNRSKSSVKGTDFWQRHVERYQQTQQSKRHYCKQHRLVYHQFLYWLAKLTVTNKGGQLPQLVPITLSENQLDDGPLATLHLSNGVKLSIHHQTTLFRLIKLLN